MKRAKTNKKIFTIFSAIIGVVFAFITGATYCVSSLNLSYGTNEGAHNGKSLLEIYINTVSAMAKCVICVGTGNEGVGRKHAGGKLEQEETVEIELAIEGTEKSLELELWKNYPDRFSFDFPKSYLCLIKRRSQVKC